MLTDENVEKENETLPPSLCFPEKIIPPNSTKIKRDKEFRRNSLKKVTNR